MLLGRAKRVARGRGVFFFLFWNFFFPSGLLVFNGGFIILCNPGLGTGNGDEQYDTA